MRTLRASPPMRPTAHAPDVALLLRTGARGRPRARAGGRRARRLRGAARGRRRLARVGVRRAVGAVARQGGALRLVEVWQAAGAGAPTGTDDALARRAWEERRPVWLPDGGDAPGGGCRLAFPVFGATGPLALMSFASPNPRECDDDVLDTVASLGSQIGQFVERDRAQRAVRESDARKSAILNAAYDCIITLDHRGRVVELNDATERTFGYAAVDMVGHELIELVVPPAERDLQRRAFARFVETGEPPVVGRRVELTAMRADGTEFPIDLAITRPDFSGPPLFCCYVRDLTERHAAERALRRDGRGAGRAAARRDGRRGRDDAGGGVRARDRGGRAPARRPLGEPDPVQRRRHRRRARRLERRRRPQRAGRAARWSLDGDTAAVRVRRTGRPARVDDYGVVGGALAATLRELGFRTRRRRAGDARRRAVGRDDRVERRPEPASRRCGAAARRLRRARRPGARQRQAREELAASRARIVEAGDAERRRLERNLHDGAQQRLVSLSLHARARGDGSWRRRRTRAACSSAPARTSARPWRSCASSRAASIPAVLTDRGLEPALGLAGRACAAAGRAPSALDERLPEPVEVAAYYVVAEALTNAARHAQASTTRVDVARDDGIAARRGAPTTASAAPTPSAGSGLRGLADRVEALGGRLVLESAAGGGHDRARRDPLALSWSATTTRGGARGRAPPLTAPQRAASAASSAWRRPKASTSAAVRPRRASRPATVSAIAPAVTGSQSSARRS